MKRLIQQNRLFFYSVLFLFVVEGIFLLLFSKEEVTLWVNIRYSRWLDTLILCMDQVGTIWLNAVLIGVLWIWKGWKTAVIGAACFLGTALVVFFLKYVVFPGTPRPTLYFEGKEILRLLEGVVQLKTESFPSGHTAAAFSIATVFAFTSSVKRYQWFFVLLALIVGYGRIYLSQHFITDVYVGMIVGVVVSVCLYNVMSKLLFKDL